MKKLVRACVEALVMVAAVIAIVGGMIAFVAAAAVVAQKVSVWLFPALVLGAYLVFVAFCYVLQKGGKKREVSSVGNDNPSPGSTGSVVKLTDETVATAILESKRRYADRPPDGYKGP